MMTVFYGYCCLHLPWLFARSSSANATHSLPSNQLGRSSVLAVCCLYTFAIHEEAPIHNAEVNLLQYLEQSHPASHACTNPIALLQVKWIWTCEPALAHYHYSSFCYLSHPFGKRSFPAVTRPLLSWSRQEGICRLA